MIAAVPMKTMGVELFKRIVCGNIDMQLWGDDFATMYVS